MDKLTVELDNGTQLDVELDLTPEGIINQRDDDGHEHDDANPGYALCGIKVGDEEYPEPVTCEVCRILMAQRGKA